MSRTGATAYRPGGAYYTPPDIARRIVARWTPMFNDHITSSGRMLRVLDPSAGGGAFPMALMHHGLVRPGSLEVMDLDPDARALQLPGGFVRTVARATEDPVLTGFLVTDPQQRPDLVIGNPPFGVPRPPEPCRPCKGASCRRCKGTGQRTFKRAIPVAKEHIERSLQVSGRWVLLLLRLAMLEAKDRVNLWRDTPLRHVDILPSRPEFMAVCMACAGTGLGALPRCYQPPPCEGCAGTGRIEGKGGGDATAYGAFLWDHEFTGPPTLGWLT